MKNGTEIFAEKIYETMFGLTAVNHELIRLIVSVPKEKMNETKSAFKKLYNQSLDNFILVSLITKLFIQKYKFLNESK